MTNNSKRNLISDYVIVIKASANRIAVGNWHTREGVLSMPEKPYAIEGDNVPLCLGAAAMKIMQAIEGNIKGQMTFILPNEAVLKAFSLQKCLKKARGDVDAASAMFFKNMSWMSEIYKKAASDLLGMLADVEQVEGLSVYFAKESNLTTFDLAVEEGVKLSKGQKLTFKAEQDPVSGFWRSTALDGAVTCENHFVNGELEVLVHTTRNPNTGEEKYTYRIPRVIETKEDGTAISGRSLDQHILNLRKVWDAVRKELPTIKAFNGEVTRTAAAF